MFYSASNHKSFKRGKSVNNILAILEKKPEILELVRLWQQLLPDLELALSHFLIVSRGLRLGLANSHHIHTSQKSPQFEMEVIFSRNQSHAKSTDGILRPLSIPRLRVEAHRLITAVSAIMWCATKREVRVTGKMKMSFLRKVSPRAGVKTLGIEESRKNKPY